MIEGKYVNLRSLEKEDLKMLRDWRNKNHVKKSTREYRILGMLNQKIWFDSLFINNPPKDIMFGVTNKKNKLIGVTGLTYIDWKNRHAEISIYFHTLDWQKTKEASDCLKLVMNYGFEELNLNRLWVEVFSLMKENINLFKKMKFIKEGIIRQKLWRNGKWWDSIIYSKLFEEFKNEK